MMLIFFFFSFQDSTIVSFINFIWLYINYCYVTASHFVKFRIEKHWISIREVKFSFFYCEKITRILWSKQTNKQKKKNIRDTPHWILLNFKIKFKTKQNKKMASQRFCLRWNNHQSNLLSVFDQLLHAETFTDVTLAVEGQYLKAHKVSVHENFVYFKSIFCLL